jgi:hypothetical protein
MDRDLRMLLRRLASLRRGNGRRYRLELREQLVWVVRGLRQQGATWRQVGDQIGIPTETIRRFCAESPPGAASSRWKSPSARSTPWWRWWLRVDIGLHFVVGDAGQRLADGGDGVASGAGRSLAVPLHLLLLPGAVAKLQWASQARAAGRRPGLKSA